MEYKPYKELFIWSIICNKLKVANYLKTRGENFIAKLLIGCRLFQSSKRVYKTRVEKNSDSMKMLDQKVMWVFQGFFQFSNSNTIRFYRRKRFYRTKVSSTPATLVRKSFCPIMYLPFTLIHVKHVRIRTITFSFFILKVEVFYFSFQNLSISDYENEAIEILDVCNSVDKETAGDLVNTRLPQYGKRTLMELAALSKRQKFISHNRCKIEVDKIWRNKIVIQDGELLNIMVINRFEIVDGF